MVTRTAWLGCWGIGLMFGGWLGWSALANEPEAASSEAVIEALEEFNLLVGDWRGVGLPKRGSQQGAWQETAVVKWELSREAAGLKLTAKSGKLWSSALISYLPAKKLYTVQLQLPDDTTRSYTGKLDKEKLVVESEADEAGEIHRLSLAILNENRLTALFEKCGRQQSFYNRVAELGYQRQGTTLAASDGNGPECVVTGGKGTIAVMHKGKTYYVCCTGCRDAFVENPEAVLMAYAEKKKAKQKP